MLELDVITNFFKDVEESLDKITDESTGKSRFEVSEKAVNWCVEMIRDCNPDGGYTNYKTLEMLAFINSTAMGVVDELEKEFDRWERLRQQVIDEALYPYISNQELVEWLNGVPNVVRWIDMAIKQWRDLACSAKTLLEYAHAAHVRFLVDTMFKHICKQMEKENGYQTN